MHPLLAKQLKRAAGETAGKEPRSFPPPWNQFLALVDEAFGVDRDIAQRSLQLASQEMSAIVGYADKLLDNGPFTSEQLQWVQTIRRQGEHLLTILNDLLDPSKIEANKLQIEMIPCNPRQIVNEAVSLMRVRAGRRTCNAKSIISVRFRERSSLIQLVCGKSC